MEVEADLVGGRRQRPDDQPDLERQFAKTMGAKTITVASSHVPMLSHANEVARLIIDAAKGVPID